MFFTVQDLVKNRLADVEDCQVRLEKKSLLSTAFQLEVSRKHISIQLQIVENYTSTTLNEIVAATDHNDTKQSTLVQERDAPRKICFIYKKPLFFVRNYHMVYHMILKGMGYH